MVLSHREPSEVFSSGLKGAGSRDQHLPRLLFPRAIRSDAGTVPELRGEISCRKQELNDTITGICFFPIACMQKLVMTWSLKGFVPPKFFFFTLYRKHSHSFPEARWPHWCPAAVTPQARCCEREHVSFLLFQGVPSSLLSHYEKKAERNRRGTSSELLTLKSQSEIFNKQPPLVKRTL